MQEKPHNKNLSRPPQRAAVIFVLFSLLLYFPSSSVAQTLTSSPYSRYGIGEVNERGLAYQLSMGGLGFALANDSTSPFYINVTNPASYSSLRLTTFDAAVLSNTINVRSDSGSQLFNNTSLGYITLGFPIGRSNRWGTSIGLLPFSSVGYNITDNDSDLTGENITFKYEGSGGLNQFYLGNGVKLLPARMMKKGTDLSLGFNASYIFGSISNVRRTEFSSANSFNTRIEETITVGDFNADLGLLYSFISDSIGKKDIKDIRTTLGFTFGVPMSLHTRRSELAQTYKLNAGGIEQFRDTLVNIADSAGTIDLPMSLGMGITIKRGDRWTFGADVSMQEWSELRLFGEDARLNNSMRISGGLQYIPRKNLETKGNYLERVHYRVGGKYRQTYLEIKNTQLNEYSVSFGLGLPLRLVKVGAQYSHSIVNVAVELGERGTLENNLLKEQFVRAMVSFTLNDRWFIPRKYD